MDKITFHNIVTRLCLHPSCEMTPPPYFVIKKVEARDQGSLCHSDHPVDEQVNDVGKKTGGVYTPDLLQVIVIGSSLSFLIPSLSARWWEVERAEVRAVVVAAIKAAPNQLGNPLADSLGAGPSALETSTEFLAFGLSILGVLTTKVCCKPLTMLKSTTNLSCSPHMSVHSCECQMSLQAVRGCVQHQANMRLKGSCTPTPQHLSQNNTQEVRL